MFRQVEGGGAAAKRRLMLMDQGGGEQECAAQQEEKGKINEGEGKEDDAKATAQGVAEVLLLEEEVAYRNDTHTSFLYFPITNQTPHLLTPVKVVQHSSQQS